MKNIHKMMVLCAFIYLGISLCYLYVIVKLFELIRDLFIGG